jgi:hypothetical protein
MKAIGLAVLVALAPWARADHAYLAPWVVVEPGDPGPVASSAPAPTLSPNSPGILLEVPHDALGTQSVDAATRTLVTRAHAGGWRAGISVELHDEPEPVAGAATDAMTAEKLFPGLGTLLSAASGADLYLLSFPRLTDDPRPYRWVIRKVASEIRAANPGSRIGVLFAGSEAAPFFPTMAAQILSEEVAAYVDLLGLRFAGLPPSAPAVRTAADAVIFGLPLFVQSGSAAGVPALLHRAADLAEAGAPFFASPLTPGTSPAPLLTLGSLMAGDFARDARSWAASGRAGEPAAVYRAVSGNDLGGLLLVPGDDIQGPITLTLDSPSYSTATIHDLTTGKSRSMAIPKSATAPRLTLSTAGGPVAVVLTAREMAPQEAAHASAGVSAVRSLTAEEILARHQVWRAARDARWKRFTAVNTTAIRFRFADFDQVFDLTLRGPFFFELGKPWDWAWSEAYFNGVRWRGKKLPELPLLQPEKVSELPLALTFGDAYSYTLKDEESVAGIPCWGLDFEPRLSTSKEALYAGRVWISKSDFSVVRTRVRQLNLVGDVQSVDETTDYGLVPVPDGGEPLRFPLKTSGQWILKTFSRTTVMERETTLTDLRVDPADFEAARRASYASNDVMVRDTDQGNRYLERTKEGDRVVGTARKSTQLFGLAGLYYDGSFNYPLPLAGVYYIDLDFHKRQQQLQIFFAGILLAGSFNEPKLFGSNFDLGVDLFGIAIRGSDTLYIDGTEDKAQSVKQRTFAGNLNVGYPVMRHLKVTATLSEAHRDFASDSDTAADFVIPSDHFVTGLEGTATWDQSGWKLTGRYGFFHRSQWNAWGTPGNPDYDPSKQDYRTYLVGLSKSLYFPGFRRLQASASFVGTENVDRFSKISFGSFGATGLHGFRSGGLRGDQAVLLKTSYGIVVGDVFRVEVLYDHAMVKDQATGLDWANFGGAGVSGQFNGPWSTLVRLDAGIPVVGRSRGQTGGTINLTFLKFF